MSEDSSPPMGKEIQAAVQAVLVKESPPGGILRKVPQS
jgi:hypothetical protein